MSDTRILLKRDETIAVHALIGMDAHPGASAAEIAERLALPKAYTAKVLQRLVACGLVESRPGRNGGSWLRAPLSDLSVLSVVEAVSGGVRIADCAAHGDDVSGHAPCALHDAYRELGRRIRAALADACLADMSSAWRSDPQPGRARAGDDSTPERSKAIDGPPYPSLYLDT